jgi:hypothetical protein
MRIFAGKPHERRIRGGSRIAEGNGFSYCLEEAMSRVFHPSLKLGHVSFGGLAAH